MPLERLLALHDRLRALASPTTTDPFPAGPLTPAIALQLFESQLIARHLDRAAFELRAKKQGYYTITSAGHEGNVVLGALLRTTDPALLHYRSAAFFVERARQDPRVDPLSAVTLGLTASRLDPISGGRHKVFGSIPLSVLPQTSTIGSQLPKAVGLAMSLGLARKAVGCARLRNNPPLDLPDAEAASYAIAHSPAPMPDDALVVTSLGDASLNHASSCTALNAAQWAAHQHLPLPLLVVCEDNQLGLSVRSPAGWTATALRQQPHLAYFDADGSQLAQAYTTAAAAIAYCRKRRRPAVLHLHCVRLMGHSGADPDNVYRSGAELDDNAARDPLLRSAQWLLSMGVLDSEALLALDRELEMRVDRAVESAAHAPALNSAREIRQVLSASNPTAVLESASQAPNAVNRERVYGGQAQLPESRPAQPLGRLINWALFEMFSKYPGALAFGEDVAEKGGVYNITAGLWKRFGAGRVFNTLLDETTILGLAQGAALLDLLPVPEIQYLAFLHNAEDQLRGEAASTRFFSRGQLDARMVLRIASFGYQKGFGGHFHNDNSIAVLRDIPGLRIATPSNGPDAVRLLRTLFASAMVEGRTTVFLEPIALYTERDLFEPGDGLLAATYPPLCEAIALSEVGVYGEPDSALTLISYANGVRLCRRAARTLSQQHGITTRVIDLRWLVPLPVAEVLAAIADGGKALVVDECRRAGNVGEALVAELALAQRGLRLGLVTAEESYVPLGDAATLVLPDEAQIVSAALKL